MAVGIKLKKIILVGANLLCFLFGILFIILGVMAKTESIGKLKFLTAELGAVFGPVGILLIIIGVVTAVIALIGCIGAWKESWFLLYFYAFLVGVILLVSFIGGMYGAIKQNKIQDIVKDFMKKTMNDYGDDSSEKGKKATQHWNQMQKDLKCCGISTYEDWGGSKWENMTGNKDSVPDSCCSKTSGDLTDCTKNILVSNNTENVYQNGCMDVVVNDLKSFKYTWIVALVYCVALLFFIVIACCLGRRLRNNYQEV